MENQSKVIMIERNKFASLVKAHRKCLQMLKNMLEMGGVYRKIDEKAFILEVAEKEKKETEPSIR